MATIIAFLLSLQIILIPASTTTVKGKSLQPVKPKTEIINQVVVTDTDGI